MTKRRYFSAAEVRDIIIGQRVQMRETIIRDDDGPLIMGSVTQLASGPYPDSYLVGVAWDDPRPSIPRLDPPPIKWYTEEEFNAMLGRQVEKKRLDPIRRTVSTAG